MRSEVERQREGQQVSLTCGPHRECGHQEEDQAVSLVSVEDGEPDQEEEGEENQEGEEVPKHDPALQTEGLYDHIVQQDSDQCSEDVDQADVEDDGGAREDVLEEVDSCDEGVVRKKEGNARHQQDNVDSIVLRGEVVAHEQKYNLYFHQMSICYLLSLSFGLILHFHIINHLASHSIIESNIRVPGYSTSEDYPTQLSR